MKKIKIKLTRLSMVVLLMVIFFGQIMMAKTEVSPTMHPLNPTSDTTKVFSSLSIKYFFDHYEITLEEETESPLKEGYHITVNPINRTYKTISMTEEEMAVNDVEFMNSQSSLSLSSMNHAIYLVKAWTEDPLYVDLVETEQILSWDYDGSRVYYDSRIRSCWAANPSIFGTHWRIDSCSYTYLGYLDGGRTIASTLDSAFHNYDFGNPMERTDVTHHVHSEGYRTGSAYKHVTWTKSGEGSSLLNLRIYSWLGDI